MRLPSHPDQPTAPVAEAAAPGRDGAPAQRGRRRLWQLPTQAHVLLLALSLTPEALRRQAERALGRMHRARCVVRGRDVDLLFGMVNDMGTRHAMSEAVERSLNERHGPALRAWAKLAHADALQAAWAQALADEKVPSALWALLSHPLGEAMQQAALCEAQAWAFTHTRRSLALRQAQQQTDDRATAAQRHADALQARLLEQQQRSAQALAQSQAEAARLRGMLARLQQQAGTLPPTAEPPPADRADAGPALPPATAQPATRQAHAARPATRPPSPPKPAEAAQSRPPALQVRGKRVLCVGGIRHAVARYRNRVEHLGGQFDHHDGGIEDGLHALDACLGRADLVVCQAACINHEAYHRIKRHCARSGTPCVYLDRPSLSRFHRALGPAPEDQDACNP